MEQIEFEIRGHPPVAQPRLRHRVIYVRGQAVSQAYTPDTADGWKSLIMYAAKRHAPRVPHDGPVAIAATFLFPRPARALPGPDRFPHIFKPDRDNLEKALLDALTAVGMWGDDCQVYAGAPEKYFAAEGEEPGVDIQISLEEAYW